jgi:hypothetical protein
MKMRLDQENFTARAIGSLFVRLKLLGEASLSIWFHLICQTSFGFCTEQFETRDRFNPKKLRKMQPMKLKNMHLK